MPRAPKQPAAQRILILNGHPDPAPGRFVSALASAYAEAARSAGHNVRIIDVAALEFPWLRTGEDFQSGKPPPAIRDAQASIQWAGHLVIFYPLWLGSMPAILKAFLEQALRPGFAFGKANGKGLPPKLLKGRSARVVVTMGMPGFFYRWYYRAHSLKSLERNILSFCGIGPVRASIIGMVESERARKTSLTRMQTLGRRAA